MPEIFISYARADLVRVKQLAELVAAQGWSVFWDRDIPPGETWASWIGTNLDKARCVMTVWSEASVGFDWVQAEASEGHRRRALVPVLIDDVLPPVFFRPIQSADLRGWDGTADAEEQRGRRNHV